MRYFNFKEQVKYKVNLIVNICPQNTVHRFCKTGALSVVELRNAEYAKSSLQESYCFPGKISCA